MGAKKRLAAAGAGAAHEEHEEHVRQVSRIVPSTTPQLLNFSRNAIKTCNKSCGTRSCGTRVVRGSKLPGHETENVFLSWLGLLH
jgi:hypothetical protein